MAKKSRKEELIEHINARLSELELALLIPTDEMLDEEFDELAREAISLREMLRALSDLDDRL